MYQNWLGSFCFEVVLYSKNMAKQIPKEPANKPGIQVKVLQCYSISKMQLFSAKKCVHFFKAQDTAHCSQYFRNKPFFKEHLYTYGCAKPRTAVIQMALEVFALIIRIIIIVIKKKLRSNLCFPGVLKKNS